MKKTIIVLALGLFMTSCSSKSGKVGNVNPTDITYIKDSRTNLCFGIIGAKKGDDIWSESTSIGMACVPCESLKNVKVIVK